MIVTGHTLNLASEHSASTRRTERESLQMSITDASGTARVATTVEQDSISLSAKAMELARQVETGDDKLRASLRAGHGINVPQRAELSSTDDAFDFDEEVALPPDVQAMKSAIEALIGHKIEVSSGQQLRVEAAKFQSAATPQAQNALPPGQMGLRYETFRYYEEHESLEFTAKGSIELADGRTLDLNFEMQMKRDFVSQEHTLLEVGVQVTDPLVINFSGTAPQLTDEKYSFDLDADGKADQISFVTSNSGMLALDRNNNGKIDNGHELFGARTGNGFAELAAFDEDGNGFIDEGDSIYSQLQVWVKGPQGQDQFSSLADHDIGAIYLGAIDTEFSFKDDSNALQGELRRSSLYLSESGGTGSVQQIDLVV